MSADAANETLSKIREEIQKREAATKRLWQLWFVACGEDSILLLMGPRMFGYASEGLGWGKPGLAYVSATIRIRDSAQQYLNFPWNSSLPRSARLREILLKPPNPESSETLEAVLVSRLTRRRSQAVQDFAVWQVWSLACRRGYKMQLSSIPSLRDQLLLSRSASPAFPRQSRWGLGLSCICSA